MPSIFTRIISGEIPCYKIAESNHFFAFLDINPLTKGHSLVVPKKEVDYIFDLDDETYLAHFAFARKVAMAIQYVIPCNRIGISVVGLEVPHAHIHLIPMVNAGDMDFSNPRLSLTKNEFEEIAQKISSTFLELN
jgi:histidine triad (HIT) family protein